jgi:hypothetical protein
MDKPGDEAARSLSKRTGILNNIEQGLPSQIGYSNSRTRLLAQDTKNGISEEFAE